RAANHEARSFVFLVAPADPIFIPSGNEPSWLEIVGFFAFFTAALYGLLARLPALGVDSTPMDCGGKRQRDTALAALGAGSLTARHPTLTLTLIAIAAGVLSSYPVVFFGKSFVSPNHFATLLHGQQPAVPGAPLERQENPKGADLGAMMWQTQPYSALVSR